MTFRWILASSAALTLLLGPLATRCHGASVDVRTLQELSTLPSSLETSALEPGALAAPTGEVAELGNDPAVDPAPPIRRASLIGTTEAEAEGQAPPLQLQVLDPELFPVPFSLRPHVAFWVDIFSQHSSAHVVVHDEVHLDVIYTVLDFSSLENLNDRARRTRRQQTIRDAKQELSLTLRELAAGKTPTDTAQAQELRRLLAHLPGDRGKYRDAALRLRSQSGLSDVFAGALQRSGRYLPWFEAAFRDQGLPTELTRIPFVESMFQETARSAVAAAGMWQFMPSTGRRFLAIDLEKDERYDPIRASEAAARLLAENYQHLGSWPLAITAYNHGRYGMARAKRSLGTDDLGVIVERYRSRSFGFASRNFYAEFMAAALVYLNRHHYFPDVQPDPLMTFDDFRTQHYIAVQDLANQAGISVSTLKLLNPGLNREVWSGNLLLPKDYSLRVPPGTGDTFHAAYAALPDERKMHRQLGFRYKVRSGDTLGKIARRFGTTTAALQRANRLRSVHRISIGQVLLIPPGANWRASSAASTTVASSTEAQRHTVRRGDNLSKIARRYGISIGALKRANNLTSNTIYPRQVLVIP